MNDIEMKVSQQAGVINCNLEEIKEALELQMSAYMELEVTEDNISESKADLATLRKIKDAVDKRRKEVKKSFIKPYEEFEKAVKEVITIIDEPIGMIDGKLKTFEEKRKAEKVEHVKQLYTDNIGEYADYLPFSAVFKTTWTNKTCTDKDILYDISEAVQKVKSDLAVIEGLKSEIEGQLKEIYKNTGNLAAAIQKNTVYIEIKENIEKAKKEEEEKQKRIAQEKAEQEKAEQEKIELPEEKVEEEVEEEPSEIPFEDKKVSFTVSAWDAENVRTFLEFNEIDFVED